MEREFLKNETDSFGGREPPLRARVLRAAGEATQRSCIRKAAEMGKEREKSHRGSRWGTRRRGGRRNKKVKTNDGNFEGIRANEG